MSGQQTKHFDRNTTNTIQNSNDGTYNNFLLPVHIINKGNEMAGKAAKKPQNHDNDLAVSLSKIEIKSIIQQRLKEKCQINRRKRGQDDGSIEFKGKWEKLCVLEVFYFILNILNISLIHTLSVIPVGGGNAQIRCFANRQKDTKKKSAVNW